MYGTWEVTSSTGARCGLVAGAGGGARPDQRPSFRTRARKLFSTVFTVTSFTGFTPLTHGRDKHVRHRKINSRCCKIIKVNVSPAPAPNKFYLEYYLFLLE
jgi:hypothetical protein